MDAPIIVPGFEPMGAADAPPPTVQGKRLVVDRIEIPLRFVHGILYGGDDSNLVLRFSGKDVENALAPLFNPPQALPSVATIPLIPPPSSGTARTRRASRRS